MVNRLLPDGTLAANEDIVIEARSAGCRIDIHPRSDNCIQIVLLGRVEVPVQLLSSDDLAGREMNKFQFKCPNCAMVHHRNIWSVAHFSEVQTFSCECGQKLYLHGAKVWKDKMKVLKRRSGGN